MEISQLYKIIMDSSDIGQQKPILRSYDELIIKTSQAIKPIKVITGLRRSGKSFVLKKLYHSLIKSGIPRENLLFLNFEHDALTFV